MNVTIQKIDSEKLLPRLGEAGRGPKRSNRPSSNINPNGMWAVGGPWRNCQPYEDARLFRDQERSRWNDIVAMGSSVQQSYNAAMAEGRSGGGGGGTHASAMASASGKTYYSDWIVTWTSGPKGSGISGLSYENMSDNVVSTFDNVFYNESKGEWGMYVDMPGVLHNPNGYDDVCFREYEYEAISRWVLMGSGTDSQVPNEPLNNEPSIMDEVSFAITLEGVMIGVAAVGNNISLVMNVARFSGTEGGVYGFGDNAYKAYLAYQYGYYWECGFQSTQALAYLVGTGLLYSITPQGVRVGSAILIITGMSDLGEAIYTNW